VRTAWWVDAAAGAEERRVRAGRVAGITAAPAGGGTGDFARCGRQRVALPRLRAAAERRGAAALPRHLAAASRGGDTTPAREPCARARRGRTLPLAGTAAARLNDSAHALHTIIFLAVCCPSRGGSWWLFCGHEETEITAFFLPTFFTFV